MAGLTDIKSNTERIRDLETAPQGGGAVERITETNGPNTNSGYAFALDSRVDKLPIGKDAIDFSVVVTPSSSSSSI